MTWQLKESFSCTESGISNVLFSSNRLIIRVQIPQNPNNWISAGWCQPIFEIPEIGIVKGESKKIDLDTNKLLEFVPISSYRISVGLRIWISSAIISIWEEA